MDKKILIPMDIYKEIYPWLIEDTGYKPVMFCMEFHNMVEDYEYNLECLKEEELLTSNQFDILYNHALKVCNYLIFDLVYWRELYDMSPFINLKLKQLQDSWNQHIKTHLHFQKNDENVYFSFIFLTGLYIKYKITQGLFDISCPSTMNVDLENKEIIRIEILELYKFLRTEIKDTQKNMVEIRYNGKKLLIKNTENWFTQTISRHLDFSVSEKDATIAPSNNNSYYRPGRKGRKPDVSYLTLVISAYRLIKRLSFSNKGLTNVEGYFILDFLKFLNAIEEGSKKDDILNLRATIKNLLNKNYEPEWFDDVLLST